MRAGLWGSFAAAFAFFRRDQEAFGHTAVLAGSGIFGAAIMLIAQMYHIDGHPPDAVLVWGLGAALAGIALRSPPALILATLLLALWSGWESTLHQAVHWAFVPAWIALTVASLAVTRWRAVFLLLALVLAGWTFCLGPLWFGPAGLPSWLEFRAVPDVVYLRSHPGGRHRRGAAVDRSRRTRRQGGDGHDARRGLCGLVGRAVHRAPSWRPTARRLVRAGAGRVDRLDRLRLAKRQPAGVVDRLCAPSRSNSSRSTSRRSAHS